MAATTLVANATVVSIPVPDGDMGSLTNWTTSTARSWADTIPDSRMIHLNTATADFTATHTGVGVSILPGTRYTVGWDYGNGASGTSGQGTATWTVELGTVDGGGVFTSLFTLNQEVTTTINGEIFWAGGNQMAGNPLVFTTSDAVSGDELSVKLSLAQGGDAINWAGFDDITLTSETVPEPSSSALLGLGGLALILRRRK